MWGNLWWKFLSLKLIENRAYEYPDAAAVNKLYASVVNVTKFLNSFLFFLLQENGHVDSGDYQCIDITLERVGLLYWFFKVKFVLSLS